MKTKYIDLVETTEIQILTDRLADQMVPDKLMELIQNPKYEFNSGQSSRMLNYYEQNGFLQFHREGSGKRRLSLSNILSFKFCLYLKRHDLSNSKIAAIIEKLNEKDQKGISEWDLLVYMCSTLISMHDFWLDKTENFNHDSIIDIKIFLSATESEHSFPLTQEIRDTFFNGQGNMTLSGKSATFLPHFIYQIDFIRNKLKWPQLSPDNFKLISDFGEEKAGNFIDTKASEAVNNLPISEYKKIFDILHKDEVGNIYGIEIKLLNVGKNLQTDKLTTDLPELFDAIQQEIRFLQKMKLKLSKS